MATKNITYKIPQNNKEISVHPDLKKMHEMVLGNSHKIRNYRFEINGIPFQTLRENTRKELINKAKIYTNGIKSLQKNSQFLPSSYKNHHLSENVSLQTDKNSLLGKKITPDFESVKNRTIIQTGHEPIIYYPGVWIKNHLAHYLSETSGGTGVNMIVDNDSCNTGFIHVPLLTENTVSREKISLVPSNKNIAYEEVKISTGEQILRFKDEVTTILMKSARNMQLRATIKDMQNTFNQFIDRLMYSYNQGCIDMADLLTSVRTGMEAEFGIHNLEIPVSEMCESEGFYHFFWYILDNANFFANIYNKNLSKYRKAHKIRSRANPLPDLYRDDKVIELPFWMWEGNGQRKKCFIVNEGKLVKVTNGEKTLIQLSKATDSKEKVLKLKNLKKTNIKIRPKAITTTMFSRLFFSDLFIHGVGGAKYDGITDDIIKEFFCVTPPDFAVITCTLLLPFSTFDMNRKSLEMLQHEQNDMHHNPERYASPKIRIDPVFVSLWKEKESLIHSTADCNVEEKQRIFHKIKELNIVMQHHISKEIQKKKEEIDTIKRKQKFNEIISFRNYPICIYPIPLLQEYYQHLFSDG